MLFLIRNHCFAPVVSCLQAPGCPVVLGMIGVLSTVPMAIAQVPPQLTCDYVPEPQESALTPEMSCMLRFDAIEINGLEPLSSGQPPSRYSWFMRQAEDRTTGLIPSLFKQSPTPTTLDLLVLGQNDVAVAPLFNLRISQQDWQKNPSIKYWGTYYPEAAVLLNMNQPVLAGTPESPAVPTPAAPTPATPDATSPTLVPT
ncbi:MAG: hypothetical protein VKJ86_10505, partial [Synechococcus sp.]|nr:hypothetical protein [Synechococcus sp.]